MNAPFRFGDVRKALDARKTSAVELVGLCFERIRRRDGEGARAFVRLNEESALIEAAESDRRRASGVAIGPLDGIPVSIKDSIDEVGKVTNAGSRTGAMADRDSAVVRRLKAAGVIIVGRTNMTEYAYSGLGLNPHFGAPASPWRRDERRIAGGSSAGAAVSISDGMAVLAVGSDTGGSIRIPAAFCGVVGFKPTQDVTLLDGVVPLAPSLDSVGPLAADLEGCAALYATLAARTIDVGGVPDRPLRLGWVMSSAAPQPSPEIAAVLDHAISRLRSSGCEVSELTLSAMEGARQLMAQGRIGPYEAHAALMPLVAGREEEVDPRVLAAILRGATIAESEYRAAVEFRNRLIKAVHLECGGLDALLMPSVPILPPRISDVETDIDRFMAANYAVLSACLPVNLLGMSAVSLPVPNDEGLPIGLQLAAPGGMDDKLLRVAIQVQSALK